MDGRGITLGKEIEDTEKRIKETLQRGTGSWDGHHISSDMFS